MIKIPRYLATSGVLIVTFSRVSSKEDGLREEGDTFNAMVLLGCRAKLFDNIHLEILFSSDLAKLSNLECDDSEINRAVPSAKSLGIVCGETGRSLIHSIIKIKEDPIWNLAGDIVDMFRH